MKQRKEDKRKNEIEEKACGGGKEGDTKKEKRLFSYFGLRLHRFGVLHAPLRGLTGEHEDLLAIARYAPYSVVPVTLPISPLEHGRFPKEEKIAGHRHPKYII